MASKVSAIEAQYGPPSTDPGYFEADRMYRRANYEGKLAASSTGSMYRRGLDVVIPLSAVFDAAQAHDTERLSAALKTTKGKLDAADFVCPITNRTPLIAASEDACIDCAELLLIHGADPNKPGPRGQTPLMSACKLKRPDLIELLLKHNALVGLQDDEGQTALMYACFSGSVVCMRMIHGAGADLDAHWRI